MPSLPAASAEKSAASSPQAKTPSGAGAEKKKTRQTAAEKKASDETDGAGTDGSGVPEKLHVNVPGGTQDQSKCTGKYTVVPYANANGKPVWVHSRADRWLYYGNDGFWYVGDEEEHDLNFDCDQGYVRHEGELELLPHQLTGAWERGEDWSPDSNIWVSLDGTPPSMESRAPKASKGKAKGKGKNGSKGSGK